MEVRRAVAVIIENDQNEILLSQRSEKEESEKLKWENVGGKVEGDEMPEESVRREALEEIGVELNDVEFLFKESSSSDDNSKSWEVYMFKAKAKGEPQNLEQEMCNQIKWFNKADLQSVDLASYTRVDFIRLGWIK